MEDNMMEKEYLINNDFMGKTFHKEMTVWDFMFKKSSNAFFKRNAEEEFEEFIQKFIEDSMKEEKLSTDTVLNLMEIDSIVDTARKSFSRIIRYNREVLEFNARNFLIDLIITPNLEIFPKGR